MEHTSFNKTKSKPSLELADVFRLHKHSLPYVDDEAWKVINAITACRTEKLGTHVLICDNCYYKEISYNSCRNRHCPKCQGLVKARWILHRDSELLPVHYFHIVFTIPSLFNPIVLSNKKIVYSILFQAVKETIKEVAAHPENLGIETGFFTILHTWDQKLNLHPHIHSVVPGGGFKEDKSKWIHSRKNFFVSVKKLSIVFRAKFLRYLRSAYDEGNLVFAANSAFSRDDTHFTKLLIKSCKTQWVVYSKPPFKGPYWVVRYLARYTHRIALSNFRLFSLKGNQITFKYRDRKNGNISKLLTLDVVTFMKRFLYHILPKRFVRIRYYGFMANVHRKENIRLIRNLLGVDSPEERQIPDNWVDLMIYLTGVDPTLCKRCGAGHMIDMTPRSYPRRKRKAG